MKGANWGALAGWRIARYLAYASVLTKRPRPLPPSTSGAVIVARAWLATVRSLIGAIRDCALSSNLRTPECFPREGVPLGRRIHIFLVSRETRRFVRQARFWRFRRASPPRAPRKDRASTEMCAARQFDIRHARLGGEGANPRCQERSSTISNRRRVRCVDRRDEGARILHASCRLRL